MKKFAKILSLAVGAIALCVTSAAAKKPIDIDAKLQVYGLVDSTTIEHSIDLEV